MITIAEDGYSRLNIYNRQIHGLSADVLREFADSVNQRDEMGTLHPVAPVSCVPRRFLRDLDQGAPDLTLVNEFKGMLEQFLHANETVIKARDVLVDLHVCSAPVPAAYLEAVKEVFKASSDSICIERLAILDVAAEREC